MSLAVIIVLRLLHVVGGVAWAGATFMLAGFVAPTIEELGTDGGKFMQSMSSQTKFNQYMAASAGLTVVSGILLYWNSSGGLNTSWITSGTGLVFTIGGIAALIQFVMGIAVVSPASRKLGELGSKAALAGGPPPPEVLAEMKAAQDKLVSFGRIGAYLLLIAVICMAVAPYS